MADYNGDLKVVATKLDTLTRKIDRIEGKMDDVCETVARHDVKVCTNTEEIKTLRKKSDAWNAGNSIGILIAYVAAAFGIHESGG